MEAYFEDYMSRSLEIRRLSMPPAGGQESAGRFYEQFQRNFTQIKTLLAQNRRVLEEAVYRPLKRLPDLTEDEADRLLSFSDALADTRTLEMVDVRLALMIVNALEPYYDALRAQSGGQAHTVKYLHCLYRKLVLNYNVGQICDRGRVTDPLSNAYKNAILACAEKMEPFLDDLPAFASLPGKTRDELITMELFRATGYERLYYDEHLVRCQVESYLAHIARLQDPSFRACCPDTDWDFEVNSANTYLAAVHEFLYWEKAPEDILRVLDRAADQAVDYARAHPDNFRVDLDYAVSTKRALDFYLGRIDMREAVERYRAWAQAADEASYDRANMDANLLSVIFVLWLCRRYPEEIPNCRDFLTWGLERSFRYIKNARDQGTYNTLQRYTGYLMDDYIELPGGITFRDFYLNVLSVTQPTLYVHSYMAAQIALCMFDALYAQRPDLLIGVCGCKTAEDVRARRDELRAFLRECCLFHDAGKLFFIDTINLFHRMLFSEEFELIKLHPVMGWSILRKRASTRPYADAALYHHKWYDGKGGYPADADYSGVENAILYQIITCADCIDAATDSVGRTYSAGKTLADMVADLRSNAGRMFNPDLVALFDDPALQERIGDLLTHEREQTYYRIFGCAAQGGQEA